jgi:hypothetical protein
VIVAEQGVTEKQQQLTVLKLQQQEATAQCQLLQSAAAMSHEAAERAAQEAALFKNTDTYLQVVFFADTCMVSAGILSHQS